jgi:hypothetical protein
LISRVRGAATITCSDLPFVVSVCFVEGRESHESHEILNLVIIVNLVVSCHETWLSVTIELLCFFRAQV